jgi:predicted HAD superfamily Cof-like phosphohydrolase
MSKKICNYMEMMKKFHKSFCVPISTSPKLLSPEDTIRRLTLITSEVGELGDAMRTKDLIEIADALGDILYVTFGCAVEMGLPMDRIFREIHRSNMSKVWCDGKVHKDEGGKVLKPPGFGPVDLLWLRGL